MLIFSSFRIIVYIWISIMIWYQMIMYPFLKYLEWYGLY